MPIILHCRPRAYVRYILTVHIGNKAEKYNGHLYS
uniref:Uncharacterized protein n=1 Tax=Anguilla anguilla TaxID=7936 RepID=A0A0E9PG00_ANGAN